MSHSWHCDMCTYLHRYPNPHCVMCQAPRTGATTTTTTTTSNNITNTKDITCSNSMIVANTTNTSKGIVANPYTRNSNNSKSTTSSTTTKSVISNPYLKSKPNGFNDKTPLPTCSTPIQTSNGTYRNPYLKKKSLNDTSATATLPSTTTNRTVPNRYLKTNTNTINYIPTAVTTSSIPTSTKEGGDMTAPQHFNNITTSSAVTTKSLAGLGNNNAPSVQNPYVGNKNSLQNSSAPTITTQQHSIVATTHASTSHSNGASNHNQNTTTITSIITTNNSARPVSSSSTTSTTTHMFFESSKSCSSSFEPGPIPIDPSTKHNYIYPVNPDHPKRLYQWNITRTALFHNTLVSLPTGLGKTLIAAVVMYNYRRWFQSNGGKVVFCAPTRPLVTQQIKACYQIMGMPLSETAEISGRTPPMERKELWKHRHVFFCTPQTLVKDLASRNVNGASIVCLVLDEAHKATGKYDYVSVIPLLEEAGARFRILGLSATPGTSTKSIQGVIDNLRISKIEVRLETDSDVVEYIHDRHMEIVTVKPNTVIRHIEHLWMKVVNPILDKLRKCNALSTVSRDNAALDNYSLMLSKDAWYLQHEYDPKNKHCLDSWFYAAFKLVSITQELQISGIGQVKTKLLRVQSDPRLRTILDGKEFKDAWEAILDASWSSNNQNKNCKEDLKKNNPKLEKLEQVLIEHFERKQAVGESTRAIVFSQFRDAVDEIVNLLLTSGPLLKPSKFVGQSRTANKKAISGKKSSSNTGSAGMKQWEQQKAIQNFSAGLINVLVCTCIGEEGLDIGEVDLIVNFDCLKSPIRMIQRVGRTGRKRDGRVICLASEGLEVKKMLKSETSTKAIERALKKINSFRFYCQQTVSCSYMIFPPNQSLPQIHEQMMDVTEDFRLTQVGGHQRKNTSSEAATRTNHGVDPCRVSSEWGLTLAQEEMRQREFGDNTTFFSTLLLKRSEEGGQPVLFPLILRRKFLRARQQANVVHAHSTDMGNTRCILKSIQQNITSGSLDDSLPSINFQSKAGWNTVRRNNSASSAKVCVFGSPDRVDLRSQSSASPILGKSPSNAIDVSDFNNNSTHSQEEWDDTFFPYTDHTKFFDNSSYNVETSSKTISSTLDEMFDTFKPSHCITNGTRENHFETFGGSILTIFGKEARRKALIDAPPCLGIASESFGIKRVVEESIYLDSSDDTSDGDDSSAVEPSPSLELFERQMKEYLRKGKILVYNSDVDFECHDNYTVVGDNIKGLPVHGADASCYKVSCKDANVERHHNASLESSVNDEINNEIIFPPSANQICELPDTSELSPDNVIVKFRLPTPVSSYESDSDDSSSKSSDNECCPRNFDIQNVLKEKFDEVENLEEQVGRDEEFTGNVVGCDPEQKYTKNLSSVESRDISISFLLPAHSSSSSSDSDGSEGGDSHSGCTAQGSTEMYVSMGEKVIDTEAGVSALVTDGIGIANNLQISIPVFQKAPVYFNPQDFCAVKAVNINEFKSSEIDLNVSVEETPVVSARWKGRRKVIMSEDNSPLLLLPFDAMTPSALNFGNSAKKSGLEDISFLLPTHSSSSSSDSDGSKGGDSHYGCTAQESTEMYAGTEKTVIDREKGVSASTTNGNDSNVITDNPQNSIPIHQKAPECFKPLDFCGVKAVNINEFKSAEIDLNASMEETPVVSARWKGRRKVIMSEDNSPSILSSLDVMTPSARNFGNSAKMSGLEEEDEDVTCLLCHCADSTEQDPIVFCDGPLCDYRCKVTVHKLCYQIDVDLDLIESWRCEPCEELHNFMLQQKGDLSKISPITPVCSICLGDGGAMKRTPAPEAVWVHPLCMYWMPKYSNVCQSFREEHRLGGGEIVKVSSLQKAGAIGESSECLFCHRKHGAVKCAGPNCKEHAHPYCAIASLIDKRWFLLHHRLSKNLGHIVKCKFSMYCDSHRTYAASLVEREGKRATEIFGGFSAWKKRNCSKVHFACSPLQATQALGLFDSDEKCKSSNCDNANENHRKKRLRNCKMGEARKQLKQAASSHITKLTKVKQLHIKHQKDSLVRRFFDEEAALDTDENIGSDDDEERHVRQMEEDYSQDSFINDSTQLGYTQDDVDVTNSVITQGCGDDDALFHRRVDNEIVKSKMFATPIFKRGARRSPGCSAGSLRGLGSMCFIRSVLEHHRQGGGMTQIENEFHRQPESYTYDSEEEEANVVVEPKSRWKQTRSHFALKPSNGERKKKTSVEVNKRSSDLLVASSKSSPSKCATTSVSNHPSTTQDAAPEAPESGAPKSSRNVTEEETHALIERKRQEALKRYHQKQKMSRAVPNPYLKKQL